MNHAIAKSMRAPLTSIHSHYRTRILSVMSGVNPLTACASVLLSLSCKLQETSTYQNIHALYEHLVHEIKAFETNAQSKGYRAEPILIARYLLCTVLDEAILSTAWGKTSGWENRLLLETFQCENFGGERFFVIIERLSEEPTLHIDLLELAYLCLSLGYEGHFQQNQTKKSELDQVMDDLYQRIRFVRGDIKKQLLITPTQPEIKKSTLSSVPLWLMILTSLLFLFTVTMGSAYLIHREAASIYQQALK